MGVVEVIVGEESDGYREQRILVVQGGKESGGGIGGPVAVSLGVWDVQFPAVNEFDGGGVLAEGFDFFLFDRGCSAEARLDGADGVQDFGQVLPRFGFVHVLQRDVVARLGFHVRDGAREGEDGVGFVEGADGVGDDPEVGGLRFRDVSAWGWSCLGGDKYM